MDKEAARKKALALIRKKLGAEIDSASKIEAEKIEVIPTGSLGIDKLTGIGGYPKGRIIEIYGPNASGKTTLTLHAIANCQRSGGMCAFIDAEHTFHREYATALGVDLDKLDLHKPDSGEEALEAVDILTKSHAYDLIVVDSVSALVPQKEVEGEMGDSHVGLQARLMGQALRKLASVAAKSGTTIIFLNQLRMKIGVMFGSPETTSGGNSLPFYASLRLDVRRIGTIKKGEDVIGGRTRVKVKKNKFAGTAAHSIEFDMHSNNEYGAGISYVGEVFEAGVKLNIVDQAGAWYTFEDGSRSQGKDNAVLFLKKHPAVFEQLNKSVRQALLLDLD